MVSNRDRCGPGPLPLAASRIAASVGDAADQLHLGLAVAVELVRRDVEPDQLRLLAERAAEAEAEVQRQADRQGDVRLLEPVAARA